MPTTITKSFRFEAAHRLYDPTLSDDENTELYGPCARLHGHSYEVRVTVGSNELQHGMVIDFTHVSALVNEEIIGKFDHQVLSDLPILSGIITTAEELASWIWDQLAQKFDDRGVFLRRVEVCETVDAWATVTAITEH
jgi:6-pyruvoyltetrahydropterin/6-carboxytetrahydropterin synthase